MTAADYIAAVKARAAAATSGPWLPLGPHVVCDTGACNCVPFGVNGTHGNYCGLDRLADCGPADAEFIAHARTDVERLVAFHDAVMALCGDADESNRAYLEGIILDRFIMPSNVMTADLRRIADETLGDLT